MVESSAASVGGAHVEGALFSESREGKGKLGRAWKLNRPTTSSRTFRLNGLAAVFTPKPSSPATEYASKTDKL